MVWLYIVCFGTYIGFSSALPKLMLDVFGYVGEGDGLFFWLCFFCYVFGYVGEGDGLGFLKKSLCSVTTFMEELY